MRPADGELLKMESPERGWRKVERIKVMGDKFDSILPEVARWATEKEGFSVAAATATEVTITAESSAQAEKLAKALNKTGLLTAQVSGESVAGELLMSEPKPLEILNWLIPDTPSQVLMVEHQTL